MRLPRLYAYVIALSQAHIQVLQCVAEGKTNSEISRHLKIPEKRVVNYLERIFVVLRVGNRTQAVLEALRHDLLSFDQIPEPLPTISPFSCPECNLAIKTKHGIQVHIALIHRKKVA